MVYLLLVVDVEYILFVVVVVVVVVVAMVVSRVVEHREPNPSPYPTLPS